MKEFVRKYPEIAFLLGLVVFVFVLGATQYTRWTNIAVVDDDDRDGTPRWMVSDNSNHVTNYMREITPATSVAVTTSTSTFDVSGCSSFVISAPVNVTGIAPAGGEQDQLIRLRAYETGSNTIRFDDSATLGLGGSNVTLTEGQPDTLWLYCVQDSITGTTETWAKIGGCDND